MPSKGQPSPTKLGLKAQPTIMSAAQPFPTTLGLKAQPAVLRPPTCNLPQ